MRTTLVPLQRAHVLVSRPRGRLALPSAVLCDVALGAALRVHGQLRRAHVALEALWLKCRAGGRIKGLDVMNRRTLQVFQLEGCQCTTAAS